MISWLLSIAFSWFASISGPVILAGIAVVVLINRMERLAIILGAAAAIWFGAGMIYQQGDARGAARVQVKFDAYKLQVLADADKEAARRDREAAEAIAGFQIQLDAKDIEAEAARKIADDLQALIASRPPVPGRGATADDVKALR